jgi:hypothetical protein
MRVVAQFFRSSFKTWEGMFEDAATFASTVPPDRLISISHSEDHSKGVVVVWFWEDGEASSVRAIDAEQQ